MGLLRNILIAGSQNRWVLHHVPRYRFVRRAVSRFMPGEKAEDALVAAQTLQTSGLGTIFTYLGENISDSQEAEAVKRHYLGVLDEIRERGLKTEVSVKLTQLGLDLGKELCYEKLEKIIQHAGEISVVWIDMEGSKYVDVTLELFRRARLAYPNVGVCLQAYLYRTAQDLASLMPLGPAIRLVKGAYSEPPEIAFPRKADVDENFFALSRQLLSDEAKRSGVRAAIATHDPKLIRRIEEFARSNGVQNNGFEFQMLYGIQRPEQLRLAREGWPSIVLIAYGTNWFPWYIRRLAERPANVLFILRNLLSG